MKILDTVQRLYPYQQRMLDADIPAEAMLEWCRRPHRCVRLVTSRPSVGDAVRGYSGRTVVDEFGPILFDMLDYLPGGDDPLTYYQALEAARQGCMVQCSFGDVQYLYHEDVDCLLCIDMEQPSDVERCSGWRIVSLDD